MHDESQDGGQLEFHLLSDLFPPLGESAFADLVGDIKAHGQRVPIMLFEGKILDGRMRYRACQTLGIEPQMEAYTGDNPISVLRTLNIHRRHLTKSQIAVIAVEYSDFEALIVAGRNAAVANLKNAPSLAEGPKVGRRGKSSVALGIQWGVSKTLIEEAVKLRRANPKLAERVKMDPDFSLSKAVREMSTNSLDGSDRVQFLRVPVEAFGELIKSVFGFVDKLAGTPPKERMDEERLARKRICDVLASGRWNDERKEEFSEAIDELLALR